MMSKRIVVGVTGASGAPYLLRLLRLFVEADVEIHLTISTLGKRLLAEELNITSLTALGLGIPDYEQNLVVYNDKDLGATIASGTFLHDGMIILPCSSITNTLVQRAAAVTLKEKRMLVLAHRESPLSLIDLRNMCTVTEAGGVIAPLSPGFYMMPESIGDIIDFMAGKLADLVSVPHDCPIRWKAVNEQQALVP